MIGPHDDEFGVGDRRDAADEDEDEDIFGSAELDAQIGPARRIITKTTSNIVDSVLEGWAAAREPLAGEDTQPGAPRSIRQRDGGPLAG